MMTATRGLLVLVLAGLLTASATPNAQVSFNRIARGELETRDWLTYSGGMRGQRHSQLTQITPANVKNLELQWVFQARSLEKFEATPLVVDGVMYNGPGAQRHRRARCGDWACVLGVSVYSLAARASVLRPGQSWSGHSRQHPLHGDH